MEEIFENIPVTTSGGIPDSYNLVQKTCTKKEHKFPTKSLPNSI